MSATVPCTPCCTTPQSVNIPGPEGIQGNNGTNGINAFTLTTASITTPAIGATVTASVGSTAWMVLGMIVIIGGGVGGALANPGPQTYKVTGIGSLTSVTLQYLGYPTDSGASISAGAVVTAAGVESLAFPTTSKGDLIVDDGANNPNPHPVRLADGLTGQALFADPNNTLGGSVGTVWKGGTCTIGNNITPVGNGADTTEDNLMNVQVPGGALAANGDSLEFEAIFTLTNPNPDHIQIYVYLGTAPGNGGTLMVTTGNITQATGSIRVAGRITRTGASAELFAGLLATSTAAVTFNGTAALNTSNPMYVSATGKEITNGTASVIVQVQLLVKLCAV